MTTAKSNRVEEGIIIKNIDLALDLLYVIDFKNYREEKENYYYKLLKELK